VADARKEEEQKRAIESIESHDEAEEMPTEETPSSRRGDAEERGREQHDGHVDAAPLPRLQ